MGMSGYWKWKGTAGHLGIPCILETECVSHETTWEMRVCKKMVKQPLTILLNHSVWYATSCSGNIFPRTALRETPYSVLRFTVPDETDLISPTSLFGIYQLSLPIQHIPYWQRQRKAAAANQQGWRPQELLYKNSPRSLTLACKMTTSSKSNNNNNKTSNLYHHPTQAKTPISSLQHASVLKL